MSRSSSGEPGAVSWSRIVEKSIIERHVATPRLVAHKHGGATTVHRVLMIHSVLMMMHVQPCGGSLRHTCSHQPEFRVEIYIRPNFGVKSTQDVDLTPNFVWISWGRLNSDLIRGGCFAAEVDEEIDSVAEFECLTVEVHPPRTEVRQVAEREADAGFDAVDDASMRGNNESFAVDIVDDLAQTLLDAKEQFRIVFVTRRVPLGFEIAGVLLFDLGPGQTAPLACVSFGEIRGAKRRVETEVTSQCVAGRCRPIQGGRSNAVKRRFGMHCCESSGASFGLVKTQSSERGIGLALPPALRVPFRLSVTDHQDLDAATSHARPNLSDPIRCPRLPPIASMTMATLRLFASVREAAGGERSLTIAGDTVNDVIQAASEKFGDHFAALLPTCKVWVNGEPAEMDTAILDADEVAILPPVSGG